MAEFFSILHHIGLLRIGVHMSESGVLKCQPDVLQEFQQPALLPVEIRTKIAELEARSWDILNVLPQADGRPLMPVTHQFLPGVYLRTVTIPAGLVVVGKIHRHAHLNFILRGDVTFVTEHDGLQRVQGPKLMISQAGTKRALYTHEETVWMTVHATQETDLEKIEAEVIAKSYAEIGMVDPVLVPSHQEGVKCLG